MDAPTITLRDLNKVLDNIEDPVILLGPPGVGKTQAIKEYCSSRKLNMTEVNLAAVLPLDMTGLPIEREPGFSRPFWLSKNPDLIFFDEISSCSSESLLALAQILGERRCGVWDVPSGTRLVCAGNRPEDKAGARVLPAHIVNRCAIFNVIPDVQSWVEWARRSGIDPRAIAYAGSDIFARHPHEPRGPNEPWLSYRSLTKACKFLQAGISDTNILSSFVPHNVAMELVEFYLVGSHLPTMDQIIKSPNSSYCPMSPKESVIMTEIITQYISKNIDSITEKAFSAIATYLGRCPGVLGTSVAQNIGRMLYTAGMEVSKKHQDMIKKYLYPLIESKRGII